MRVAYSENLNDTGTLEERKLRFVSNAKYCYISRCGWRYYSMEGNIIVVTMRFQCIGLITCWGRIVQGWIVRGKPNHSKK